MKNPFAENEDTYSYKGWLISDNFWKRALASVGYQIMGTLFIYLIIMMIFLFFALIAFSASFIRI